MIKHWRDSCLCRQCIVTCRNMLRTTVKWSHEGPMEYQRHSLLFSHIGNVSFSPHQRSPFLYDPSDTNNCHLDDADATVSIMMDDYNLKQKRHTSVTVNSNKKKKIYPSLSGCHWYLEVFLICLFSFTSIWSVKYAQFFYTDVALLWYSPGRDWFLCQMLLHVCHHQIWDLLTKLRQKLWETVGCRDSDRGAAAPSANV